MSSIFNKIKYPYETKVLQVGQHSIAYIDEGDSENVLVFVHGLGSYIPVWKFNIPDLQKRFRCIAIDLPGFGKSGKELHPATMEYYCNIIVQLLNQFRIRKFSIIGHSMGGQIAINFGVYFGTLLNKIVLVSSAGIEQFDDDEIETLKRIVTADAIYQNSDSQIEFNFRRSFFSFPEEARFLIDDRIAIKNDEEFYDYCRSVSDSVAGMIGQRIYADLDKILVPTLIIFGKQDSMIPNPFFSRESTEILAVKAADLISDSRLVLFDDCGHFPQIEKIIDFNKVVSDFILS